MVSSLPRRRAGCHAAFPLTRGGREDGMRGIPALVSRPEGDKIP
jgi:hypothetical protein